MSFWHSNLMLSFTVNHTIQLHLSREIVDTDHRKNPPPLTPHPYPPIPPPVSLTMSVCLLSAQLSSINAPTCKFYLSWVIRSFDVDMVLFESDIHRDSGQAPECSGNTARIQRSASSPHTPHARPMYVRLVSHPAFKWYKFLYQTLRVILYSDRLICVVSEYCAEDCTCSPLGPCGGWSPTLPWPAKLLRMSVCCMIPSETLLLFRLSQPIFFTMLGWSG